MSSKVESQALDASGFACSTDVDGCTLLDQLTEARNALDATDRVIKMASEMPPKDEVERDQLRALLKARQQAAARLVDATRAAVEFATADIRRG
jgi:hypothetical protein